MKTKWKLVSDRLSDGSEMLVLSMGDRVLCTYMQAKEPFTHWHVYYRSFPKAELSTRDACIRNAEKIAGRKLEVTNA